MMSNYAKFIPEFDLYDLADSDVLAISYSDRVLVFFVDARLSSLHAAFTPPPPGIAGCWRKANIKFGNVQRLEVIDLEVRIQDPDDPDGPTLGEVWSIVEEDDHLLFAAAFGTLRIWSDRPSIVLVASEENKND